MEFTEKQKEIIQQIKERNIIDLYSYITSYLQPEVFKYDVGKIEELKKQDYEKNKGIFDEYLSSVRKPGIKHLNTQGIIQPHFSQSEYSPQEIEEMRKKLCDYSVNSSDFNKEIEIKGELFKINTLKEEVYLVNDLYSAILEFISVWNILESKQLVLSVNKQITKDDAKLFFKKTNYKESSPEKVLTEQRNNLLSQVSLDLTKLNLHFNPKRFYKNSDREYSDVRLNVDVDALAVAEGYLDRKILILPNLLVFVQEDFLTNDEKKYLNEKKRANIATTISFISVLVALASMGFSYLSAIDNTRFWEENEKNELEQIKEIDGLLSELINQLLDANIELNKVTESNANFDKKINDIEIEINKIGEDLKVISEIQSDEQ